MTNVVVRCAVQTAIVEGSRQRFVQGQRVRCQVGCGHMIAAYQGMVIARRDDGSLISGGLHAFEDAATSDGGGATIGRRRTSGASRQRRRRSQQ